MGAERCQIHGVQAGRLCQACAAQFAIAPDARLPGDALEMPDRIPYVAPTCGLCFTAWLEHGSSQS